MSDSLKGAVVSVTEVLQYLNSDPWMDKKEAAGYLRMKTRTLEEHLKSIRHYKPSGKVLFRKSDLDAWVQQSKHEPALRQKVHGDSRSGLKAVVHRAARSV